MAGPCPQALADSMVHYGALIHSVFYLHRCRRSFYYHLSDDHYRHRD